MRQNSLGSSERKSPPTYSFAVGVQRERGFCFCLTEDSSPRDMRDHAGGSWVLVVDVTEILADVSILCV